METRIAPVSAEREQEYERLVESHRAALQRLARRLARDAEDAEDLLQETLIDAYRAFRSFQTNSHFYSWVARIMTNNHLDRIRRKRHPVVSLEQGGEEGSPTLDLPDESANPEVVMLQEQLDGPFQTALESLQPAHRATVVLCDLHGATYEEAARAEECPIGTIRSRLHRAHHALRKFLAKLEPSGGAPPPAERVQSRRAFLRMGTAAASAALTLNGVDDALAGPEVVRVRVWAPEIQSDAYPFGLAETLAEGLRGDRRLEVTLAEESPEEGLAEAALDRADVLVLWGDGAGIPAERRRAIAARVRDEGMGLVAIHAGERPAILRALLGEECEFTGACSPARAPLDLRVTAPKHPIARGLEDFRIPETERWESVFRGPRPEMVVLDGKHPGSEAPVWQGMVWTRGRGRLFYFQPGHEGSPVLAQEEVRKLLRNAARWCGGGPPTADR